MQIAISTGMAKVIITVNLFLNIFSDFCSNFTVPHYTYLEEPIICTDKIKLQNSTKEICPSKFSDLQGDGICHDALNHEAYYYDVGDCCSEHCTFGQPFCIECECKVSEVTVV